MKFQSSVIEKRNFKSDSNHENQSQFKSGSYPPELTFPTTLKKTHTHTFNNAKTHEKQHFTMKKTKNTFIKESWGFKLKLFYMAMDKCFYTYVGLKYKPIQI